MRRSLPFTWFSEEVISKVRAGGWGRSVYGGTSVGGARVPSTESSTFKSSGVGESLAFEDQEGWCGPGAGGASRHGPLGLRLDPSLLRKTSTLEVSGTWPVSPRRGPSPQALRRGLVPRGPLAASSLSCHCHLSGDLQQMQILVKPAVTSGAPECENMPTGL